MLMYGSYITHGGFYSDDWGNAAAYRFAQTPRYFTSVGNYQELLGGRPVLAALLPLPHALFGASPAHQLALALALAIATSLCFYVLLRTLAMAPLHAGVIASLSLLFPWSDSIRLWSTASLNSVAVCLFLGGLILALRGLERRGRMSSAMHCTAVGLYALSVLTYQVAAAAALLAGCLYLGRAPRREAIGRWLADIAGVLGALVYSYLATSPVRHVPSLGERISDVSTFLHQSLSLLALALNPSGPSSRLIKDIVLLLVGLLVIITAIQLRRTSADNRLRYWATAIAVASVGIAAGYFMLLAEFKPLDPGIGNRGNIFVALPYSALVYSLVVVGAKLLTRKRQHAALLALAAVLFVGIGYGVRVKDDESSWVRASLLQHEVLATIARQVPRLPKGSTLLTFGYPAEVAPGVPIFARPWDLLGALRLQAQDPTLQAAPVTRGIKVLCRNDDHLVVDMGDRGSARVEYGTVFFLDVPTGRHEQIRSFVSCKEALRTFRPGPSFA